MEKPLKSQSAFELLEDARRLRAMARAVGDRAFAASLEEQARKLEALAQRPRRSTS
jgi:hypothetical protein